MSAVAIRPPSLSASESTPDHDPLPAADRRAVSAERIRAESAEAADGRDDRDGRPRASGDRVAVTVGSDAVTLAVSGELDVVLAPRFRALLATSLELATDPEPLDLVIDLSGLRFLSSCGIRAIAQACGQLDAHNRSLTIVGASRTVRRLLDVTGVSGLVKLVD